MLTAVPMASRAPRSATGAISLRIGSRFRRRRHDRTAVRARKPLPLVPECHTSVEKRRRPEPVSRLLLNRSAAVSGRWGMDERQKLQSDLKRYRTLRDLIHDEPAMATIEEMIREAEDRLRQIESGSDQTFVAT